MFARSARGAAGSQYSIVLGLIAIVALGAVTFAGRNISGLFTRTANTLTFVTNSTGAAPDEEPDAVDFTDVTGAETSTLTSSDIITLSGFDGALTAAVSGGGTPLLSVNGGGYVASAPVSAGNTLRLRLTSSSGYDTPVTATVALGAVNIDWSVRTRAGDFVPDGFSFGAQTGQALNTVVASSAVTIAGFDGSLTASVSGAGSPEISVNGGGFSAAPQTITAGQTLSVRLTSASAISTTRTATVTVGTVSANYDVTTTSSTGPWTFNNCGASGYAGPSTCSYSGSLAGQVTVSAGIQSWTIPASGTYRIQATGAAGGVYSPAAVGGGGTGTRMAGNFSLTSGTVLRILVGQMGTNGGGGGGTFVTRFVSPSTYTALVVAGGGGGKDGRVAVHAAMEAQTGTSGGAGSGGWAGGTSGNGSDPSCSYGGGNGGGGGGFSGNAGCVGGNGGYGFLQGGNGCSLTGAGGFGGGGCTTDDQGAGGGGYSGGGGSSEDMNGGGGGSFNGGTTPTNEAGIGTGHGQVVITYVGP